MKTIDQLRYEFGEASGGTIEDYVYQYMQAEIHEYGKHLQGKVLDLTQELEDAKYEIETLRGQIVDRDIDLKDLQEKVNDLDDSLHNSETELDKFKSERKEIIESNASQAMKISFLEPYKERYESAILEGDLLRTKNEELEERIIECEGDYQDICELAGRICIPTQRKWLIEQIGEGEWERFKNHIGW